MDMKRVNGAVNIMIQIERNEKKHIKGRESLDGDLGRLMKGMTREEENEVYKRIR